MAIIMLASYSYTIGLNSVSIIFNIYLADKQSIHDSVINILVKINIDDHNICQDLLVIILL